MDRTGPEPLLVVLRELLDIWHNSFQSSRREQLSFSGGEADESLTEAILFLHSRGVNVLWQNYIEGDIRVDPNLLRIWVQQGPLGLPDVCLFTSSSNRLFLHITRCMRSGTTLRTKR